MKGTISKSVAVVIMALFIGSMFYFNPENILTDLPEENQVNEQLIDTKPIDSVIVPPSTRSVIDYNAWYSDGPSILTDIEFNKQMPDFLNLDYMLTYESDLDYFHILYLEKCLADDSTNMEIVHQYKTSYAQYTHYYYIPLYCGGSGTFYYESFIGISGGVTTTVSGSYLISSSMIDSLGYTLLKIEIIYSASSVDYLLKIINQNTGSFITVIDETTSCSATSDSVTVYSDVLYFQRDTITNNIRSEIKYTSPTVKIISSIIPSVPHAKEIRVYTDLDYSSINPSATVTRVSDYWKIDSPTELTYEIIFSSNCSNILAIDDVSTNYLTDINFETGLYQNDWDIDNGTISTSNIYVFDGYQSLNAKALPVSISGSEGYYPFDVDASDEGSNGIDGTLKSGAYITSDGIKGNCLYTDGINDYVDIATEVFADGENEVSFSLWFKTMAIAGTLFETPAVSGFYVYLIADGTLKMHVKNTIGNFFRMDSNVVINTNSWFHMVCSYKENDYFKVYINGLFINQTAVTGTLQVTDGLHIGCGRNLVNFYAGLIDEFYIFHHELTIEEIKELYRYFSMSHDFGSTEKFYFSYAYYVVDDKITIKTEDETITHTTPSGRWATNFFYSDTSYFNISTNGTFYFDSFKIFKTSISISTTGYYEYTIFTPFVVADSYLFPSASYTNISLTSMLGSTSYYMTDEHGEKEITINENIVETEYTLSANATSSLTNSSLTFTPETFSEIPTLFETDTTFYLSSSKNYIYEVYLDEQYIGIYDDLETILRNNTIGEHNLTYVLFSDGENIAYIPEIYNYYYEVDADSFSVNIESFYLSDLYVNTFVKSNYDYSYYVYEDNDPAGSGTGYKEGTAISSNRDTTEGVTIAYALKFVYASETVWFNTSYSNSRSAFYVESYTIDIQAENIQIIWSTTKPTIDSLTVYEGTDLEVDAEDSSPSSWVKSTVVGIHYVMLIFEAVSYSSIIYYFTYEIVSEVFEVNVESFHLSELFVNTYITASENGNYQVYENNTIVGSEGSLQSIGTSIQTDRNITEGAFINYAIKFWNTDLDEIWFNTTYSNTEGDFFVSDYSVNIAETTITITWATSLPDSDSLTVKEDGANKVDDESSPSDWTKSTVVGTHAVVLLFEADGYATITYSFNYYVYAVADFQVDIGSFQVSDDYVNTYASANYDGNYFVYEDNDQIETGLFYGAGTAIETTRDTTAGVTIAYAIKFVYESTTIWFNTTYSNPVTPFYLTDYRVEDGTTITVTWDTTLPALDSLTIYEDGVLIEDSDPESTTTWLKSTVVGNHYVTLIFSAEGYTDIIHSFSYTVYPPTAFTIYIETFYVSDDYLNIYLTATHDYSYTVYENGTEKGSGTGIASGTTIISPKNRAAGLYNFTVIFTYESTNKSFMTWYSNLIPPLHPLNDLYRTDSQGFYNISLYTNLEFFWVDVWHDSVLIIDDSTETRYSIPKALKVGLHNITLIYRYNVSTDGEGYPITVYNETITYEFWYETKLFYDIRLRYVPINYLGLMIGDAFEVSWVHTYLNGELIFDGEIDDVPEYSNYTFIANDYIRIRNNMPIHNLTITDLFGRVIMYNLTIDISSFAYAIIELPVYRLGVVNNDDESHKISIRPYLSGEDWQTTPILPPGYQTEYWVCNRTYEIRILSVGSTTYDENGAMVGLYDDITDYPELRTVPYVIVIPLDLVFEPEEEEEVIDKWWTTPLFIGCMAGVALIIILVAIYIVNKNVKKKERLNK